MGPIQVVVTDANNLVLEVTPTPDTNVILDRGVAGTAATVAVGTTTSLTPGLPATVTNVGTSAAAVLNFGIPTIGIAAGGSTTQVQYNLGGVLAGSANMTFNGTTLNAFRVTENSSPVVVQADIGTAPNEIPLNQYLGKMAYKDVVGMNATLNPAPTIASAATIQPLTPIVFISGTTTINTITVPAEFVGGGQLTLIPTGLWSTGTSGNIAIATTGVVSRALILTYDAATTKWYPSY